MVGLMHLGKQKEGDLCVFSALWGHSRGQLANQDKWPHADVLAP